MFGSACLFVCPSVGPSVWLVCLFVRSITQKRMIPKCSNLVQGMTMEYSRNDVVFGFKDHVHRVSKCIFHTNDYYAYANAHLTDNSNTAWVRTLWVPSSLLCSGSVLKVTCCVACVYSTWIRWATWLSVRRSGWLYWSPSIVTSPSATLSRRTASLPSAPLAFRFKHCTLLNEWVVYSVVSSLLTPTVVAWV